MTLAKIAEKQYPKSQYGMPESHHSIDEVIDRERAAFIAGDQRDRWISIDEQPPTEKDADEWGRILGWDRITGRVQYADYRDVVQMRTRFDLWQPLPSPPSNP